jgi:lipopolysaccharide export system protein LptA
MRILLVFLVALGAACAAQIEVNADKFDADEKRLVSEFSGNVQVKNGNDTLKAERVVIDFDTHKQPTRYTAYGNVSAQMLLDGKHYTASGEQLTYEPKDQKYILEGSAHLSETDSGKKVYGEKIEVSQLNGTYSVVGATNEPAKFIFQIEDVK